jgi:tryptophan-rich sensory protein
MSIRTAFSAIGIALVLIYAVGSSVFMNTGDNWYNNLNRPSWQPPGFVFGIIWPYNFIVLGIAATVIANRASTTTAVIYTLFFTASIVAALTWAYQFYTPHNFTAAAIALTVTALLTLPMTAILISISSPMALAVAPYQIWVSIAAALSLAYRSLN